MYAVGAHEAGQGRVGSDEKDEAAPSACRGQARGEAGAVGRAEMAIDHARAARKVGDRGEGIGRARRIGHENEADAEWSRVG